MHRLYARASKLGYSELKCELKLAKLIFGWCFIIRLKTIEQLKSFILIMFYIIYDRFMLASNSALFSFSASRERE